MRALSSALILWYARRRCSGWVCAALRFREMSARVRGVCHSRLRISEGAMVLLRKQLLPHWPTIQPGWLSPEYLEEQSALQEFDREGGWEHTTTQYRQSCGWRNIRNSGRHSQRLAREKGRMKEHTAPGSDMSDHERRWGDLNPHSHPLSSSE